MSRGPDPYSSADDATEASTPQSRMRARANMARIVPDRVMMMAMRDGVRLYTEFFFPEGPPAAAPLILIRTPYPDSTFPFSLQPIALFQKRGYVVAVQSCRGTWKSEGQFRFFQNEARDGYDAIEALAASGPCNGRIAMFGSSYLGTAQWLAARLKPPHLVCIAPQAPAGDFFYETPYLGGALNKNHLLTWPRLVSRTDWDAMGFEWGSLVLDPLSPLARATRQSPNIEALRDWHGDDPGLFAAMAEPLLHSTFDAWWQAITLDSDIAAELDLPILAITGFYDGDQPGCLFNWRLVEDNESTAAANRHLVIGGWRHAQMLTGAATDIGEIRVGDNASRSIPELATDFFDCYLRNDAAAKHRLPKRCDLYLTGINAWQTFSEYPPRDRVEHSLFLASDGHANSLFGDGRLEPVAPAGETSDRLPVDPRLPVPVVPLGMDGRDNAARYDVLVYTSSQLDADLVALGPVSASLYISVDAPDCDIVVRIEEVLEDGRSINMTGEFGCAVLRARYRAGFAREVPMAPGEVELLRFSICHMGHVFRRGSRIRLVVTGTAANLIEPNHHSGQPVATAVTHRKGVQRVHHGGDWQSCITISTLASNTPF